MNIASAENKLEELLNKDIDKIVAGQNSEFDRLIADTGESYILFGAGRLGKIALEGLRKAGIEPIAFADNNPKLWNTDVDRIQVLSPENAVKKYGKSAVFVATVYTNQPVLDQLQSLKVKAVSFASLAWKYPQVLLPHADLDLPNEIYNQAADVKKAYSLWADDVSRHEYLGQLEWRISLDHRVLPPHLPQREIYFPDDLVSIERDEFFVDCGAFDGDSIREFLKRNEKFRGFILGIEPDPENISLLRKYFSTLPKTIQDRVSAIQLAVGTKRGIVRFNATGSAASSVGVGMFEVQSDSLDNLLIGKNPTYVKMDIEGAEIEALKGGHNIIAENMPILAICAYHKQEHLWQIPLLIHSISDKYRLFLRRYSDECWELVCYAIPEGRLERSQT